MKTVISQTLAEASNFSGLAPNQDLDVDGSRVFYTGLTEGGLFDFDNEVPVRVRRIIIDPAEASAWSLRLMFNDGSGELNSIVIYDQSDFPAGPVYIDTNEKLTVDIGEVIQVFTEDALSPVSASIMVTR